MLHRYSWFFRNEKGETIKAKKKETTKAKCQTTGIVKVQGSFLQKFELLEAEEPPQERQAK